MCPGVPARAERRRLLPRQRRATLTHGRDTSVQSHLGGFPRVPDTDMQRRLCLSPGRLQARLKMLALARSLSVLSFSEDFYLRARTQPTPEESTCDRETPRKVLLPIGLFSLEAEKYIRGFSRKKTMSVCLCLTRTQKVLSTGFKTRQKLLPFFREVSFEKKQSLFLSIQKIVCERACVCVRVAKIIRCRKAGLRSPSSLGRSASSLEKVCTREEKQTHKFSAQEENRKGIVCTCAHRHV